MSSDDILLVTSLGATRYKETKYWFGEERNQCSNKTKFPAVALVDIINKRPEKVLLVATDEALSFADGDKKQVDELKDAFSKRNISFDTVNPPMPEEDQWEQFARLNKALSCDAKEIWFDITYGFRSQPFFAAAVIAFQRASGDRRPLRVFYGAYEAGEPEGERVKETAPIWELTEFVTVLDWALALHLFLKTGRAEDAARATRELKEALEKEEGTGRIRKKALEGLAQFAGALEDFGRDFETIRTGDMLLKRGDDESSAKRLFDKADAVVTAWEGQPYPIADLAGRVRRMVKPLAGNLEHLACCEGHKAVAALARLYLNFGRYNEALITMSEGIVNHFARNENAAKPATCAFSGSGREKSESDARCDQLYKKVGNLRNDIAHAQYQKRHSGEDSDPKKAKPASQIIKQTYEVLEEFEAFEKKERASRAPSQKQKKSSIFLNISNHPSDGWPQEQRQAALKLADEIHDLPFPCVPPDADEQEIERLARDLVSRIPEGTGHALVQGEFTLTCQLVRCLQAYGITCWAATTERDVEKRPDGMKVSRFRFVRLRRYPDLGLAPEEEKGG